MKAAQKGNKNSQYGSRWICNITLKQNKKISKSDQIPSGWIAGRSKWNQIHNRICKGCGEPFITSGTKIYCSSDCWSLSGSYNKTDEWKTSMSSVMKKL